MFQFVFEKALFRFKAKAPTFRPLLQLPPTRETAGRLMRPPGPLIMISSRSWPGEGPRTPHARGYAAGAGCSQESAAPTPQCVFEKARARDKAKAPTFRPASQLPPTSA